MELAGHGIHGGVFMTYSSVCRLVVRLRLCFVNY